MHALKRTLSSAALLALVAGCSGGGSPPSSPAPTPTPSPTSTPPPTTTAYTCPSSDTGSSVAVGSGQSERRSGVYKGDALARTATGAIAITYAGSSLDARAKSLASARENLANATLVNEMSFTHINRYTRVVHVPPGTEATAIAQLRQQPGVVDASITNTLRGRETVSQKYFPNDPYYAGFTQTQLTASGSTGTPTYHVDPYEENAGVPGQWGMQAVRLAYAQEYSQANNGSGVVNGGALGSSSVKIAIIDSGEDATHPELSSKIAYKKCYITSPSNVQSQSSFSSDPDGHGTNVSGIAAAASNNSLGFVGSGGNASILAYRVFPRPDDTCLPGYTGTVSSQCYTQTSDIASAINDAVAQHASVINLSLGGGTCTGGTDPDSLEGNAIANALAANVVVVAASGNNNPATSGVSAPGCDSGVIAVGASALSDGVANGSSSAPAGSAAAPVEYVASYSQFGSPAAAYANSGAWGIVAPGGDPSNADASPTATSTDDLHWIENISTSTPVDSMYGTTPCRADLGSPGGIGTADCRVLIAGTSQATPLVAGAAALIIAANQSYQSPTKMKQLLCSTAHDIGDAHEGCGRLDIYRAMATAVGDPILPASQ